MVVTSQETAVEAGLTILKLGGNAIDAAIATAACLTVVEPCSNGLGGDCFALIWDGESLHGLNASGYSPKKWTPERFAGRDTMPESGWESVTVPGQIAGWKAALERFGSLSMEACLQPAIEAAEEGFTVTPVTAAAWTKGLEIHGHSSAFHQTFARGSGPGGQPVTGDRVTLPDHGRSLRRIGESLGDDFYHGDLAGRIASAALEAGAALDLSDLADCRVDWVTPLQVDACGVTGHEIPPNGQGIAALAACGVAEHLPLDGLQPDDPRAVHLLIEAMKQAFGDLFAEVADSRHMHLDPNELLSSELLRKRAACVDPDRAGPMRTPPPPDTGTVLLVTADAEGRMVSFIQSNYCGFGSGVVVPGTGIALQNRGSGFVTTPGHPKQVGPRKRPFHTIIPGFWTRDGKPLGPFGCMGGHMQAQGHLQMWQSLFRWNMSPQACLDSKRWLLEKNGTVSLETGTDPALATALRDLGHSVQERPSKHFGGAQLILRQDDGGYIGATDPRKDGRIGILEGQPPHDPPDQGNGSFSSACSPNSS